MLLMFLLPNTIPFYTLRFFAAAFGVSGALAMIVGTFPVGQDPLTISGNQSWAAFIINCFFGFAIWAFYVE